MDLRQFIDELNAIEPSVGEELEQLRVAWPTGAPPTLAVSRIGTRLVTEIDVDADSRWRRVLGAAERALTSGDDTLGDIVATGFLEAVLFEAVRRGAHKDAIRHSLGPVSAEYLTAWGFDEDLL